MDVLEVMRYQSVMDWEQPSENKCPTQPREHVVISLRVTVVALPNLWVGSHFGAVASSCYVEDSAAQHSMFWHDLRQA